MLRNLRKRQIKIFKSIYHICFCCFNQAVQGRTCFSPLEDSIIMKFLRPMVKAGLPVRHNCYPSGHCRQIKIHEDNLPDLCCKRELFRLCCCELPVSTSVLPMRNKHPLFRKNKLTLFLRSVAERSSKVLSMCMISVIELYAS